MDDQIAAKTHNPAGETATDNTKVKRQPGRPRKNHPAPEVPAVIREPRYWQLQQSLREDILEGRIPSGSRLKVSEIAARYKCSTNPAREALQALEGEGLVVITPNKGACVRAIDETLVQNIFDLKVLIEPYFVRGLVEFASPQDVQTLEALQQACHDAVGAGDYPAFHIANVAFHEFIVNRHHNTEAIRIMNLHDAWARSFASKNPLTLAQMRRSNTEHWDLVEGVRAGDPEAAVEAMQRHIESARATFLGHMLRNRALQKD